MIIASHTAWLCVCKMFAKCLQAETSGQCGVFQCHSVLQELTDFKVESNQADHIIFIDRI